MEPSLFRRQLGPARAGVKRPGKRAGETTTIRGSSYRDEIRRYGVEVVTQDEVRRGEIFLVDLNPTRGGDIRRTRPCAIVSPDELNRHLRTFVVAPLTSGGYRYPFRVPCQFEGRHGHIVLDQIRTIDRERMIRRLGRLTPATLQRVLSTLQEIFAA
jgi:mRNA interferase MazF